MAKKLILMILDGWGKGNRGKGDVIFNTPTPNMDKLEADYPNSQLLTSGENVGLPEGQMGNSEVGHLNIGAGRVVYQDLVRINKAIKDNSIETNEVLIQALDYAKKNDKAIHFLGLIGSGGVHAMSHHLYKLCDITKEKGLDKVYIHCLTDGRDTDPKSGLAFMEELVGHLKTSNGKIASLIGRYYTMDRDKRWERIKQGYDLMVHGKGKPTVDILKAIKDSYKEGVTDEFIKPLVCVDAQGKPIATVKEGDVFLCFNFRTDRLRQITTALTQQDFPEQEMKRMPLRYLTMTRYDENFKSVHVMFDKQDVSMTLGEVMAREGKRQLRIAETEKYAHVTFFFSGGREDEFENEYRIMVPSPKVATYDLQPEMSALIVKDKVVAEMKKQEVDFICLNFANGDMVGHTGDYQAIEKAIQTVDNCVGEVVQTAQENGYTALIIADHGNADNAVNEDGSPNTAHSLNPVPCILVDHAYKGKKIENGILADVAPTILKIMGIEKPKMMSGKALV
jgi:2,3-bisphosphoglycerate-independent phosphoglycerate mutase